MGTHLAIPLQEDTNRAVHLRVDLQAVLHQGGRGLAALPWSLLRAHLLTSLM